MSVNDTNVTVTVDTDLITESNKKISVVFSDDKGDPVKPGDPANYISTVYKNQEITWTAVAKNGRTPVYFQNVKMDGGSSLIKYYSRGEGHNTYKAQIKNDETIKEGDTESYSITIGLNGYEGIAGNNEHGPIVYLGKKVAYMNNYQKNIWHSVADAPFDIEGISGENSIGATVYGGNRVAHMNYAENKWNETAAAPFKIEGIAGDNIKGAIIYAGNRVAHIVYSENIWHEVAVAPFKIDGIAGENTNGPRPIVYTGTQVAFMLGGQWYQVAKAPFEIEGIAGNDTNGPVIYAGSKVSYMSNFEKNIWHDITPAPFIIEGIAGNNSRGPVIFSGPQVKYMSDYASNLWTDVANMPFATGSFTIDPKLQIKKKI